MKKLFAALALVALIAAPAVAAPFQPAYHCAATQYDASGSAVSQYCE
jgi:hypothetical protein